MSEVLILIAAGVAGLFALIFGTAWLLDLLVRAVNRSRQEGER